MLIIKLYKHEERNLTCNFEDFQRASHPLVRRLLRFDMVHLHTPTSNFFPFLQLFTLNHLAHSGFSRWPNQIQHYQH